MNRALFPTSYDRAYVDAFKLYWSRANMPSADRLGNGIGEWLKTKHFRPENNVLMNCIVLYLNRIELTKRVITRGRDERVEYVIKPHFRRWLKDRGWQDFLESAQLMPDITQTEPASSPQRRSFRASDMPDDPSFHTKKRSIAQILEENRKI